MNLIFDIFSSSSQRVKKNPEKVKIKKEQKQAPSMNIELNIYNGSFVSYAITSIHPFTYIDTRSCTHNFMSIKQKLERKDEVGEKMNIENGIGNLLWISRINFLCVCVCVCCWCCCCFSCSIYYSFPLCSFLHFVKQGKGIPIQHLIQYSEYRIGVKEYIEAIAAR